MSERGALVVDRAKRVVSTFGRWVLTGPYTKLLRWLAGQAEFRDGVTVIAVNFNTLPYLKALVAGVRKHSGGDVPILILDNASKDGSKEWAASQPGVRFIRLPSTCDMARRWT